MNTEFQIFRWGIPGWVFLMTYTIYVMAIHKFELNALMQYFGGQPTILAGVAAFFIALGVPLGYLIYQIYFWFKWTFGSKDAYIAMDQIKYFDCIKTGNVRDDWRAVEKRFDYLMSVVSEQKEISYKDLKRRYDQYSNRTSRAHGLGASLVAMALGLITFIVLNGLKPMPIIYFGGSIIVQALIFTAILSNYNAQNKSTFYQLNYIMRDIEEAEIKKEDAADSKKTKDVKDTEDEDEENGETP